MDRCYKVSVDFIFCFVSKLDRWPPGTGHVGDSYYFVKPPGLQALAPALYTYVHEGVRLNLVEKIIPKYFRHIESFVTFQLTNQ